MLLEDRMAHARTLAPILLRLLVCLGMENRYDLSILSCKFLIHYIQFKMLIVNLELLVLQGG